MFRLAAPVLALVLSAVPAAAQGFPDQQPLPVVSYSFDVQGEMPTPASLTNLYLKHAALQGLDAMTTLSALNKGRHEANPLFRGGQPVLIVGAKVAAMSVSVYLTQKLWKRNPKAAVVTMVVTNAVLSAVVVNNSAMLRR